MASTQVTETEKRVLVSLHLRGCTGPMGNMKLAARRKLLQGLIDKKLLTEKMNLTQAGLEASRNK